MKYSVIVPVLNGKGTIGHCLDSLLNQTIPRHFYEVIVVDDGSSDGTPVEVQKYDVRIDVGPHRGPAAARNRGVDLASGEIILFTDADCRPTEKWMEEMVSPFEEEEIIAVKGAYMTEQSALVSRLVQAEFEERYKLLSRSSAIDFVDSYSAAFRKGAFLEAGGFDCTFPRADNEDVDLSYRVSRLGGRMVFNPRAIVYHLHPETIRDYFKLKFGRGYWRMLVYSRFPGKALKDSYTPAYLKAEVAGLVVAFFGAAAFPFLGMLALAAAVTGMAVFLAATFPAFLGGYRAFGTAGLFFMLVRALALGAGSLWGLLSHFVKALLPK